MKAHIKLRHTSPLGPLTKQDAFVICGERGVPDYCVYMFPQDEGATEEREC